MGEDDGDVASVSFVVVVAVLIVAASFQLFWLVLLCVVVCGL